MTETLQDNPIALRILQAGVRLFAEKGYAATSTREIAEAAGITKPMLYYYFESKEGLCRTAISIYASEVRQRLDAVTALGLDPVEHLVEVLAIHICFVIEKPEFSRMGMVLLHSSTGEVPGVDMGLFLQVSSACVEDAVDKMLRAGLIRAGSERNFVRVLLGTFRITAEGILRGDIINPDRTFAENLVQDLLDGFGTIPQQIST